MSENQPSNLQRCEISIEMALVIIALNKEAHSYGSTLETLETETKLIPENIIAALYRFQCHGLLVAKWCQEGTAGPIVERYSLTPEAKEVHIETKAGSNDGRNPAIGLYFTPKAK